MLLLILSVFYDGVQYGLMSRFREIFLQISLLLKNYLAEIFRTTFQSH